MAKNYGEWIELNNEITQLDENGKNKLYKDKEALQSYLDYVDENTKHFDSEVERFKYLIDNGLYDKELSNVPNTIINEMHKLAYSFDFKFQSFMAGQKFYETYALKEYTKDSEYFIENYEQHNVRVALYLFKDDYVKARELLVQLMEQSYQMSTPTYLNSGLSQRGELSSCYLFLVDDNIESMNFVIDNVKQASKNAGGVSVDLTRIRPRGSKVKGRPNASKGVIPFAKAIEQGVSHFDQAGSRNGSASAYLNIFHQDIVDFLSSKKINASEKVRLDTLSIGVTIPNKFMELVKEDKDFYTFDTYNLEQTIGKKLDEVNFDEEYDDLVRNNDITKKKLNARELITDIAKTQLESGYPYVFYIDNANQQSALKELGTIKMSNLCVTGDTELLTNKGYRKAKELYNSNENLEVVIDNRTKKMDNNDKGVSKVEAIPMQLTSKQADVYEIETKQGFKIKSTEWHKYYKLDKDKQVVKLPLADLKVGDKLLVQSEEGYFGSNSDTDLAYVMGLIAGDGTFSKSNRPKIYLYGDKQYLKRKVELIVSDLLFKYDVKGKEGSNYFPEFIYNEKDDKWTLHSSLLGNLLEDKGFTKDNKLKLPTYVKEGTKEVLGSYLSGLYQMDGSVNANKKYKAMSYELASISKELVEEIQKHLLNAGVYSTIYTYDREVSILPDSNREMKEYKVKTLYKLSIQDRKSRDMFNTFVELKPQDENKIVDFNTILQTNSRTPKHQFTATIKSIKYIGKEDVYDTTQEDYHSLIFNGIVTGNCTEISIPQTYSEIFPYLERDKDIIGNDVVCTLGSLNLVNIVEKGLVKESVEIGMESLSKVTELMYLPFLPSVQKANDEWREVGLGALNLHGLLAKNKISYGSKQALDLVNSLFSTINYYSIKKSMEQAKDKTSFKDFDKSDYANGKYFEKYINKSYQPVTKKAQKVLEKVYIPTQEDWLGLSKEVQKHGLYNNVRLAIAPTQSISYVQNATSSVMPVPSPIENRTYGNSDTFYPMPYLDENTQFFYEYENAYKIDNKKIINTSAVIQKHIDQAVSTILYVESEIPTNELVSLYYYAWEKGLKSLYYTRSNDLEVIECATCSV